MVSHYGGSSVTALRNPFCRHGKQGLRTDSVKIAPFLSGKEMTSYSPSPEVFKVRPAKEATQATVLTRGLCSTLSLRGPSAGRGTRAGSGGSSSCPRQHGHLTQGMLLPQAQLSQLSTIKRKDGPPGLPNGVLSL